MTTIRLPARKKCPWCAKKPELRVDQPSPVFDLCQAEVECRTLNCPVKPRTMAVEHGQKAALLAALALWNDQKGLE